MCRNARQIDRGFAFTFALAETVHSSLPATALVTTQVSFTILALFQHQIVGRVTPVSVLCCSQ